MSIKVDFLFRLISANPNPFQPFELEWNGMILAEFVNKRCYFLLLFYIFCLQKVVIFSFFQRSHLNCFPNNALGLPSKVEKIWWAAFYFRINLLEGCLPQNRRILDAFLIFSLLLCISNSCRFSVVVTQEPSQDFSLHTKTRFGRIFYFFSSALNNSQCADTSLKDACLTSCCWSLFPL